MLENANPYLMGVTLWLFLGGFAIIYYRFFTASKSRFWLLAYSAVFLTPLAALQLWLVWGFHLLTSIIIAVLAVAYLSIGALLWKSLSSNSKSLGRQHDYWYTKLRSLKDSGRDLSRLQSYGRIPTNKHLETLGFPPTELQSLGLAIRGNRRTQ